MNLNPMSWFQNSNAPNPATPAPTNPDVPAFQGTPASPTVNNELQKSPLDDFNDLLKIKENQEGTIAPPSINLNIQELEKTVSGMDFGNQVTSDDMNKIMQGDAAHLQQLLNKASQQAFLRNAISSSTVTDQMTKNAVEYLKSQIPEQVKQQGINAELAKNPNFQHQASNEFVHALASRIAANSPQASAQEVAEKTQTFLNLLGQQSAPAAAQQSQKSQDWNSFFS